MNYTDRAYERLNWAASACLDQASKGKLVTQGTVRRVDFERREVTIVADGHSSQVMVPDECQFFFEGWRCPLRCLHPLDQVEVLYEVREGKQIGHSLYAWVPSPTEVP